MIWGRKWRRRGTSCLLATLAIGVIFLMQSRNHDNKPHFHHKPQFHHYGDKELDVKYLRHPERYVRVQIPCSVQGSRLRGEIPFNRYDSHFEGELEDLFPTVKRGGQWYPLTCVAKQQIAIVIPYRDPYMDRYHNLMILLRQLHTLLQNQRLHYHVYVIHQNGTDGWFNKGMLMNLGFLAATAEASPTCIVFHDIDVVPIDDRNPYTCGKLPRHLPGNINNQTVTYRQATGGALAIKTGDFREINGFSNKYWGWGNEDDDLYNRLLYHKISLELTSNVTARYLHLPHKRNYSSTRYRPPSSSFHLRDGINSVHNEQIKLIEKVPHKLYTWINYAFKQPDTQPIAVKPIKD